MTEACFCIYLFVVGGCVGVWMHGCMDARMLSRAYWKVSRDSRGWCVCVLGIRNADAGAPASDLVVAMVATLKPGAGTFQVGLTKVFFKKGPCDAAHSVLTAHIMPAGLHIGKPSLLERWLTLRELVLERC